MNRGMRRGYGSATNRRPQGATGSRKKVFTGLVLVVVAVLVAVFIVSRVGGSEESGRILGTTGSYNPAVAPETTSSGESTALEETTSFIESTSSEENTVQGPSDGTGDSGTEAGTEAGTEDSAEEDATSADPPPEDTDGTGGADGADGSGGSESTGETPSSDSEIEPRLMDPADVDPEPGDLTKMDEERVKFMASQFVTAVYGYSGGDAVEYEREVDVNVILPNFYDSPAGDRVREISSEVVNSGVESAASVDRFEITETKPDEVRGTAYFVKGESYTRYGEIEGETTEFRQDITLVQQGEVYKVLSASVEEEAG